jgi:hypothetical protein
MRAMSKRPRIYQLTHNLSHETLHLSVDREEAFENLRLEVALDPQIVNEATFAIKDKDKTLVEYTGQELEELLEDED